MSEERNQTEQKSGHMKNLIEWGAYIIFLFVMCYLIITFVGQRTEVFGESMEPNLEDGDNLIVDKISYRFREPRRYEIIVFPYSHQEKIYYIKRIIGLPGETVQVIDGYVYIDGKLLEGETYGREIMKDPGIAEEPITLGDDEFFVLGDNRNYSRDSRSASVGVLHRDDLVGRAWVRIYPFNKI